MKLYPVMTLGELVETGVVQLTRGKVISKKDLSATPGSYPVYSSAKDNDGKFGEYGHFMFDEEMITWSVDGGGSLFHRPKHKFSVTNVGGILRILSPSVLDYKFLFYVLSLRHSKIKFDWVKKAHPSVIRELYRDIPLPPIAEQRRIVDILSRSEGIVRLRREAERKAAELIPALFLDMFGDPATNPKGWPVRKVSDFVRKFEGGKNIQAGSENGSPYRILKVSAVTSGVYRESESKPSPDDYSPPASHIVRVGDMLFSRANTEELVGATAIVETTDGKTLLPDKLWRFVWKEPVEAAYMHALFQFHGVRRELGKLSSGTSASMRNISQGKLYQLPLPIAPYKHQTDFAEKSAMIHSIQSEQAAATATAQATFDALLAQVFHITGTI